MRKYYCTKLRQNIVANQIKKKIIAKSMSKKYGRKFWQKIKAENVGKKL